MCAAAVFLLAEWCAGERWVDVDAAAATITAAGALPWCCFELLSRFCSVLSVG